VAHGEQSDRTNVDSVSSQGEGFEHVTGGEKASGDDQTDLVLEAPFFQVFHGAAESDNRGQTKIIFDDRRRAFGGGCSAFESEHVDPGFSRDVNIVLQGVGKRHFDPDWHPTGDLAQPVHQFGKAPRLEKLLMIGFDHQIHPLVQPHFRQYFSRQLVGGCIVADPGYRALAQLDLDHVCLFEDVRVFAPIAAVVLDDQVGSQVPFFRQPEALTSVGGCPCHCRTFGQRHFGFLRQGKAVGHSRYDDRGG